MGKAVKFAVSIPKEEFEEMEEIRRKEGLSRSKIIFEAIRLWKKSKKMDELIRAYEDGYKNIPESPQEIEGWEKASLATFSNEGWE
ncbi:MAG TPA: ribbon-helix-helix protein, CopG family [Syntrophaceae bacterium]|nr:ribbon-helix-helix protein, CopG family [Syntrophaceae bacterium]